MGRRNKFKADTLVKNTIVTMIKYISTISIFVSLGLILLLYLGPEINLAAGLVFRLAVPSVVLSISVTIVYELWVTNGRNNAYQEIEYQDLLKQYAAKSENLHYPTLQEFLDHERERRYQVEYDRLSRILTREEELLSKIEQHIELRKSNGHKTKFRDRYDRWQSKTIIRKVAKMRDTIKVTMPYEKSEEFDYLRYNLQDIVYKEYSPNDTKKHLAKARTKKYIKTFTFTILGLNILSIGGTMGNIWVAIIMTSLAAVTLIYSVVQGFSTGYNNIKIVSTGVYKTGNSFLDQAVAYCKREGKELYYRGPTDFRQFEPKPVDPIPTFTPPIMVEKENDIFAKASKEVT